MTTFFDKNAKRSFANVTIDADQKVDTSEFLSASEALVTLFDLLGSPAFAVVQKDMTGNIKKARDRQLMHPMDCMTIQDLVQTEAKEKKQPATEGLMWLIRGLKFTSTALRRNVDKPSEELSTSFIDAYGSTLRQYHGMLVRPAFSLAMKATPYR